MTTGTGPVVIAPKPLLAGTVAVIGSEPTGRFGTVNVATQEPFSSASGAVLMSTPLLRNETGPAGQVPLIGVIVSVSVTGVPNVVGLGPAVRLATVAEGPTCWLPVLVTVA